MKTRKTIWIMILAAVLLLVLPLSALSEEPEEPDDPEVETGEFGGGTWSFNEGELVIDGPADLDGFWPVNALRFYRDITRVTFGPEVTNIRADAFALCPVVCFTVDETNPEYKTVEGILYNKAGTRLLGVPSAKTDPLDISSDVTDIYYLAFSHCSISEINVDPGNENYSSQAGVLFDRDKTILYCYPGGKTENSYKLPGSVELIHANAFSNVKHLREIFLFDSQSQEPAEELVIDYDAFCESSLETVHFPSTLTEIRGSAFQYCDNLTNLTYEGSVSEWAAVEIGSNNTPLYLYPVICRGEVSADPRPEEGKAGENVTFSLNYQTGQLTVSGAGTWYEGAFTYTDAIRSVTLNGGVTEVGKNAFVCCENLQSVTIPDSVTRIGEKSFSGCYRLGTVTIPASVMEIGDDAFDECYSLLEITYGGTIEQWNTLMNSREDEWLTRVTINCSDGPINATDPYLWIEPIEITSCPQTVSLGEDFTVRVQPQEHVYSYSATLQGDGWEITASGSEDGQISFWDWPDDAAADTCILTITAGGTDPDYMKFGTDAERDITVTDAERPAAPDIQIRVLEDGDEVADWLTHKSYELEFSWNTQNVTAVRWTATLETTDTQETYTTGNMPPIEDNSSASDYISWSEPGTVQIRASVCVNGVWSLWSEPREWTVEEGPTLEEPEIAFVGKDDPYEYSVGEDVVFSVTLDPNTDYINYSVWLSDDEEVYSEYDIRTDGDQVMEFTINNDVLDGGTYRISVSCYADGYGSSWNDESFTVTGVRPAGPVVELDNMYAQYGDLLHVTVYADGAEEVIIEKPFYGEQTVWLTDGQDIMVFPLRVEFYDYGELRVRVKKDGILSGWTTAEIWSSPSPTAPGSWKPTFPSSITKGKDVAVTVPKAKGAKYYMVWVYGGSECLYWVYLEEPGTATIPAVVFEDGGFYCIMAGASNGVNSDWCFKQKEYYNVPSYKSNRGLSVAATQPGEWPYGSKLSFTMTPGAGVTGTMTRVIVQELIDYSGTPLGPGTEWRVLTMTEAVSNQEYTNRVWLSMNDPGVHQYRSAALVGGKWTDWSEPVTVTIGECLGMLDATDPIVPASISLGDDLAVSWSAVDNAQTYEVYLFSLDGDISYCKETESGVTSCTFEGSIFRQGVYGVWIVARGDGYANSAGRTRKVSVVPKPALSISDMNDYPAGKPVEVGGFLPAGGSGQESFDIVLEQNGTTLDSYSYELDEVDNQGRIVLVPRGLDAGEYTIRATRTIGGLGTSPETVCTLTVTGQRPTVGELTVSGAEFYIPHGVDFRFSGDRYGQEAYCMITETPDGQPAETSTENVNLWWLSDSGCVWSDYQYDPMEREYQFQLCCSDGRWTAWTDPVTVTWLSKGQAAAPALTGLEGCELPAGESLVLRGITLEENDGLPDYYVIALDRSAGDNAWEYVSSYSFSRGDLNPDGSYTAELFGLDAGEDGSAREYRLVAYHGKNGYVDSEKTEYHFTVTGTRPSMAEYVFPAGTIPLNTEAYAEISAEGITGACAASRYSRSGEVYLPEGDTVYIPLDTSWADTREYLFRARIGTRWTAPVAHEVTVSGTVRILAKPKVTVPKTFYIGRPMEVTIKPVANAEYYTVSVNRLNAEGEVSEGIYYDLVLEPDANGKALIPTLDFVDPGKYAFAFSACADGYDPGTTANYIATGSYAADAPPAPVTECLTAAPAPRQDVDFRITTDPEADQVSLLVYLVYEEYGYQELLLNASLVPAGGTADYTLNYWLVGKGLYRVRASQRVNGEWSAYSACDFTVSGEAAEQLPPVTITSFPEEIISGEPFTVSWEAAEGAASYVAEWRFNHDDVWKEVELTGATSASMTIDPAAEGMDYCCHVRISAYAPGKVGSTTEREAEILDSRGPTLAASRNQTAPDDEVILTAGNVFGDRLRVSVDNGNPELVYSRPMNGKQTFSLRLGTPGEHTVRVSCGVSEKYTPYRPEYWSCWSDAVTITVIDDTGLTPHMVTFEANGGRGRMENQTVYEETQLSLAANAFTRTGMYFDGWNTEPDGSGTAYNDKQAVSLTKDTTLYAQWEIKDIHFSVDVIDRTSGVHMIGGKVRLSGSCAVDGKEEILPPYEDCTGGSNYGAEGDVALTLEAIPSGNYSFVGWYSGEVLDVYAQTLTPVELLSEDPILDLELTEYGYENCTMICAVYEYSPAYGTAAFRVPESLTVIPESAFENIGAATVYVPDTCTEIQAKAFKDCGQLRQIRLPKDCVIALDAFDGCRKDPNSLGWDDENERWEDCSDLLTIFAPAGGTTQAWAEETAGILFAAE